VYAKTVLVSEAPYMTVSRRRVSFGVSDAVRVNIADLAAINHRDGHTLRISSDHDLADLGIDGSASEILWAIAVKGTQKAGRSTAQTSRKNSSAHSHDDNPSMTGPVDDLALAGQLLVSVRLTHWLSRQSVNL
jgi:hypothetical protein